MNLDEMVSSTPSRDLARLLDALAAWNRHFPNSDDHEPEPKKTAAYQVDHQAAAYLASQLEMQAPFVYECFAGRPVKSARAIRDWVIKQLDEEPDYDPVKALYRWAQKQGQEVSDEAYYEARAFYFNISYTAAESQEDA